MSSLLTDTTTHSAALQPLQPEDCALLVIDIQERLLAPIWQRERLVHNSQLLLRLAAILDLPVLVTTQYARGLGETVPQIRALIPFNASAYDKLQFSCFGS